MIAPGTIAGEFVAQAFRRAGASAVPTEAVASTPDRRLAEMVRHLSLALAARGVEPGRRVGMLAGPAEISTPPWRAVELAVLAAGGVTVVVDVATSDDGAGTGGVEAAVATLRSLDVGLAVVVGSSGPDGSTGWPEHPGGLAGREDIDVIVAPDGRSIDRRLLDEGRAIDARHPDRFETLLAQLTPSAPATVATDPVSGAHRELDHEATLDLVRAFEHLMRATEVDDDGARTDGSAGGELLLTTLSPVTLTGRVVGHYWPAVSGCPSAYVSRGRALETTARFQPSIAVVDGSFVEELAAATAWSGGASWLARRHTGLGRLVAAGEHVSIGERLELLVLHRLAGRPRRRWLGLDGSRLFVVGDIDPVARHELAAIGIDVLRAFDHPTLGLLAAEAVVDAGRPASFGPPMPGTTLRLDSAKRLRVGRRAVWHDTSLLAEIDEHGRIRTVRGGPA